MIMDEHEDVEETIQRLQRECMMAPMEENGDHNPYTPSYCYGCARTAGVAVYRKRFPKKKSSAQKQNVSPSHSGQVSCKSHPKQAKPRSKPQLKSVLNRQVSARIKKKAVTTLLGHRSGRLLDQNGTQEPPQEVPTKKKYKGKGFFPCPECGKVFLYKNNLKRHQQTSSHGAEAPKPSHYHCKKCGHSFHIEKAYREHLLFHSPAKKINTDDRPYACDQCDKTFKLHVYLNQHKRSHDTSRPFCCRHCLRTFKTKHSLSSHEVTHQRIKPYI